MPWRDGPYAVAEDTPGCVLAARHGHRRRRALPVPGRARRDLAGRSRRAVRPPRRPARRRRRPGRVPRLRAVRDRHGRAVRLPDGQARRVARRRRRTWTCRCSPAACSTGWSPGSTSPANRPTRPTRCSRSVDPGRRDTLIAVADDAGGYRFDIRSCRERMRPSSSRSEPGLVRRHPGPRRRPAPRCPTAPGSRPCVGGRGGPGARVRRGRRDPGRRGGGDRRGVRGPRRRPGSARAGRRRARHPGGAAGRAPSGRRCRTTSPRTSTGERPARTCWTPRRCWCPGTPARSSCPTWTAPRTPPPAWPPPTATPR